MHQAFLQCRGLQVPEAHVLSFQLVPASPFYTATSDAVPTQLQANTCKDY